MPSQENQQFLGIEDIPDLQKGPAKYMWRGKATWGLVILAATAGIVFVSMSHFDVAAKPDLTRTQAPLIESPVSSVAYFPSQYVNQAKEIEPPPPTF